ncbi:metallophosphoesterase family protein [Paramicrobacterium agarici]|uniref:metallophosphoesterase family protein n=1 Tax=Paramicrobacterium agarici TaxID=630514 RepID=UPI001152395A|nr:metallophosphoesterase [Microbacterium agarici]TQO22274.1 calcineurin-like phosphoesterase family protein [Microbacterium agarici]
MMTLQHDLARLDRIGLMGDVHADVDHVIAATAMFHRKVIRVIVQLGDFGLVGRRAGTEQNLGRLEQHLREHGQILFFVDGNHEDFSRLAEYPVSADGVRWIRRNLGHLPRGYRTTLTHGRKLAVLGGANSVDVRRRRPGISWWEQEQITDDDLQKLGTEHTDILLAHDAPLHVPSLDASLQRSDKYWTDPELTYAQRGRSMFHRGFLQVQPQLTICGHYHQFIDETIEYETEDGPFTSRVIVLDQQGKRRNCGILTPETLNVEVLDIDGNPCAEGTPHGN